MISASNHSLSRPVLFALPAQTPPAPQQSPDNNDQPLPSTAIRTVPLREYLPTSSSSSQALEQALGNRQNWHNLALKLNQVANGLAEDADAQQVASSLKDTLMDVDPASSYSRTSRPGISQTESLEAFILAKGLGLPETKNQLLYLAHAVAGRALQHPLGNFGGALSWPLPLSVEHQRSLQNLMDLNTAGLPGLPHTDSPKGALGYLLNDQPLSAAELQDPAKALERLVRSPRADVLGRAIREQLNGIPTATSLHDYVLAAINIGLDHESISQPGRNSVAGFDLDHQRHWGQPASTVVGKLHQHLIDSAKATERTAGLASHVLLARTAPQFLVKDIPASVVYGSQAWTNLCIAVSKIEANAPGTVANMNFAQVMTAADGTDTAPQSAQKAALLDWGIANGIVEKKNDDLYTPSQLEQVRTAFNQQQNERISASRLLNTDIPSRKAIALTKLKQQFGNDVPFEEKSLWTNGRDSKTRLVGKHSMLDIAMMELGPRAIWSSDDSRIPLGAINANPRLDINKTFQAQFDQAIDARKKGIHTTIKHLISQLPLEDRKKLEHGKLDFYQDATYQIGTEFISSPRLVNRDTKLLVTAEQDSVTTLYEIDLKSAVIRHQPLSALTQSRDRQANRFQKIENFTPSTGDFAQSKTSTGQSSLPPRSFSTDRTQQIADAFVEHLDLDNVDILNQAKGSTTFDQQTARAQKYEEFLLNLIPLRSAIVNFKNNRPIDGAMDLALDVFGFATAGAGAAAKVAKVTGVAASTASKALKSAKIIGVSTIGAFNPLGGIGDLAVGAARLLIGTGKLVVKGTKAIGGAALSWVSEGIDAARSAASHPDLLRASQKYGISATGTFTLEGHSIEATAILHNRQWHAFDPSSRQPYGPPLEDFTPKTAALEGKVKGVIDSNLGNWLATWLAPTISPPDLPMLFSRTRDQAKAIDNVAYNQGYAAGRPDAVRGYYPSMNIDQLKDLVVTGRRPPEEIGTLIKLIEKQRIKTSLDNFAIFSKEIKAAGGEVIAMPQGFYLSQTDLLSEGECAALSNAMALAIQEGRENVLIENFFTAISAPQRPEVVQFRANLHRYQEVLENQFHGSQTPRQVSHREVISELANAQASKTLMIRDKSHGLTAGVIVEGENRKWFYFDPNFGLAKFASQEAMERGLESTLNSGRTRILLQPYGPNRGSPHYKVVDFNEIDLMISTQNVNTLSSLFAVRL